MMLNTMAKIIMGTVNNSNNKNFRIDNANRETYSRE